MGHCIEELSLTEVRCLYKERMVYDFPENELKPLNMIEASLARGTYSCLGMKNEEGAILAYGFFVRLTREKEEIRLFDYLAVRQDLRDKGLGSAFLQELSRRHLKDTVLLLLEVDDPARAPGPEEKRHRERRLSFYLRNGLRDTGVTARVFGADFRLLEFPLSSIHAPLEISGAYEALYRSMLPDDMFRREVHIQI